MFPQNRGPGCDCNVFLNEMIEGALFFLKPLLRSPTFSLTLPPSQISLSTSGDDNRTAMTRLSGNALRSAALALLSLTSLATAHTIDESQFSAANTIIRDVAIIGGGASGTYAAVRLREDFKKSVVVVEATDHLVSRVLSWWVDWEELRC